MKRKYNLYHLTKWYVEVCVDGLLPILYSFDTEEEAKNFILIEKLSI
jgi:hypothetical protein